MRRFRTIPGFVRLLVAVFLVAQLAGAVPSSRAQAQPLPPEAAMGGHDHHAHSHGAEHKHHNGRSHASDLGGHCCALHAFFAGIVAPAVAIAAAGVPGTRLSADPGDRPHGVAPDPLDRPPKALRLI